MNRVFYSILFSLLFAIPAEAAHKNNKPQPRHGSSGVLQGTILNCQTQEPITGIVIKTAGKSVKSGVTIRRGKFRFRNVKSGKYQIQTPDGQILKVCSVKHGPTNVGQICACPTDDNTSHPGDGTPTWTPTATP